MSSGRTSGAARVILVAVLVALRPESSSRAQHWWEMTVPTGPPAETPVPENTPAPVVTRTPEPTRTVAFATATVVPSPTVAPSPTPTPEGASCKIAVLDQPPAEAFELIGLVEVRPQGRIDTPEGSLEAAKLQGCSLGADALVIVYRRERSADEPRRLPPGVRPGPSIRAAAIRYRQR